MSGIVSGPTAPTLATALPEEARADHGDLRPAAPEAPEDRLAHLDEEPGGAELVQHGAEDQEDHEEARGDAGEAPKHPLVVHVGERHHAAQRDRRVAPHAGQHIAVERVEEPHDDERGDGPTARPPAPLDDQQHGDPAHHVVEPGRVGRPVQEVLGVEGGVEEDGGAQRRQEAVDEAGPRPLRPAAGGGEGQEDEGEEERQQDRPLHHRRERAEPGGVQRVADGAEAQRADDDLPRRRARHRRFAGFQPRASSATITFWMLLVPSPTRPTIESARYRLTGYSSV